MHELPVSTLAAASVAVLWICSSPCMFTARILALTPPSEEEARKVATWARVVSGRNGGKLQPETCPARDGGGCNQRAGTPERRASVRRDATIQ